MSGKDDAEEARRYAAPYSARHPIPTISKYREEREARQQEALDGDDETSYAGHFRRLSHRSQENEQSEQQQPQPQPQQQQQQQQQQQSTDEKPEGEGGDLENAKDTSQTDPSFHDPKQRRKDMKKNRKERAEREVTDPVTHLPVKIHDFTDEALKEVEINDPPSGSTTRTATGLSGKSKSGKQLGQERREVQDTHDALAGCFPPPDFDALRHEMAVISQRGVTFGLAGVVLSIAGTYTVEKAIRGLLQGTDLVHGAISVILIAGTVAVIAILILSIRKYMARKIEGLFQDEVWDAQRQQTLEKSNQHDTETTVWLNSLIGSVWPLVNPDLFTSLADTLEDVMQASLPKLVRMVSVEDIGQGSEALRILGVRWLPTGAASRAVGEDGKLMSTDHGNAPDIEETDKEDEEGQEEADKNNQVAAKHGMEAEEGDFINLEVAFAYRTRSSSKSLRERTKNMHLNLSFYLPGNLKIPVWVDLQGIIGTMRLRLQLTPDPPFFALCTITFLGQPKVDLSCVPLSKHGLNIMDVPLISNFVQSAVDAAMAEYVAPKSLTLDLKDMLAGDDFKKDTAAVGVLMINIKRGYEFKCGDAGIPLIKEGSADPYVSVGWAKFGKVLWTSRILEKEMEPVWDETCFVLVTPEELNIDERLRIQLWDSDRFTADDDLGRIEMDLKDLMKNPQSNGRMAQRKDGFKALKSGDGMPGKLEWSVGYYSKTRIQQCQLDQQKHDTKIRTLDQLKQKVNESVERKLRETMLKEGRSDRDKAELKQQRNQELKAEEDAIVISAPPPDGYPSGLFSLQIHNITGLELEKLSKNGSSKEDVQSDEEEAGEGLPSAYCTVIMNHRKTFKTRTKPQNSKPFYNAGCERFVRDWRECEIYISVRDARIHEDDALLGIVHLSLGDLFQERTQVMGFWPLTGGIGYGRIRLSMTWRSVQLQAPRNLLGWQYGTVEVQPTATVINCPDNLKSAKLKFRTNISTGKMYTDKDSQTWKTKKGNCLRLAVQNRYSSCLSIDLRDKGLLGEDTAAFGVVWLKDIVDEEDLDLEIPVWKGDIKRATKCSLDQCGERVATIKVRVKFWSGLGAAHSKWACDDINLRNVVEVIDTARDNLETDNLERRAGIVDESGDSDTESDSSDDDIPDGSQSDKQGPIDQIRDYKKNEKGLHRRHRGVMQWRIPRTAKWIKGKVHQLENNVSGVFDHSNKQPGIETEV